ncbi:alpha/beta fold hydrolase [Sphingomonas lutea]|uniref:Alpha/beta fold hydrolase n=1 Tax=Sphingomonas lutea TaxID=1045317 RepID=A0A7G9SHP1_9SPHN|nr:alpha/beta fold hydrolase [Sphingomonas lutea]QNN67366.1 alpha/beta fold hydrolase [Sphingomonas lutea]
MKLPILLLIAAALAATPAAAAQPAAPAAKSWATSEGTVVLKDFAFRSGQRLPQLRMRYLTLGQPRRNGRGEIDNAVMVLHGTGGSAEQFLRPQFADELYGPGQPLDIRRYFIILPDNLGHGKSSKPSDGMRMAFPNYDYDDMVEAQRRMLAEGLGIKRLRLIMGTSMGCMHIFVWGQTHPAVADALMPMACMPVEIAGLNRMWRQLAINGIKFDPAWQNGNYGAQPLQGLRTAQSLLVVAGSAPLYFQKEYPTQALASANAEERVASALPQLDANDLIYQLDASRTYNPRPRLEAITAPTTWINSADDFINPRNFGFPAQAVRRMGNATFRLIPETDATRGHSTHTWAKFWKDDLSALLVRTAR